ncbi:MAG: DUF4230 domain-containing protein [Pseudomonadota bacterium]
MDRRTTIAAFAATYLAAGGVGYWLAPRELLDSDVKRSGFFQKDTTRVLSATVDSLRAENKLLVYAYRGSAQVEVERSVLWVFGGSQVLIVPAAVNYYLDLSKLSLADVTFNEKAKLVTVKLPPLVMADIAFEPEGATTINGGVLTYSQATVDELNKLNYAQARRAITKQAQGKGFVEAAQGQAIKNVQSYFEVPLRIGGQPDVRVVATFR